MATMSTLYWGLMGILCLLLPVYAIISGPRAKHKLVKQPHLKVRFYKETLFLLFLMAGSVIAAMLWEQDSFSRIGLGFIYDIRWLIGLAITTLALYLIIRRLTISAEKAQSTVNQFKEIEFLLPFTSVQLNWTMAVSIMAGIAEEIVYRGFVYQQFNLLMPWPLALVLTNVVFALMHYATNPRNMINTWVLGMIFSAAYLLTGTLWLSIILHIAVDFYSMTLSYKVYQHINKGLQ